MEEQARRHQEEMNEQDRRHKEKITVLIDQVKVMEAEMKHLIEAACDGAIANPTPSGQFPAI